MIKSFKCNDTQRLFAGKRVHRFDGCRAAAEKRLDRLNNVTGLDDLTGLPSNHFTHLGEGRAGHCSIRINLQWCIYFDWHDDGLYDVEIVEDH